MNHPLGAAKGGDPEQAGEDERLFSAFSGGQKPQGRKVFSTFPIETS